MHEGLPRWVEATLASAVLALLAPLLAVIALVVRVSSGRPVLFRQTRIGRGGHPFEMLKFRTMQVGAGGPAVTAGADPRVTRIGRILRRAKIDELPELWNVIRGDMSLVGPRPEATRYVDLSNALWREVLAVRPGITDPTTLRLRNEEELLAACGEDYEQFYREHLLQYKLRGYRDYLNERSWKRDIAVLWSTLLAVVFPARVPAPSAGDIQSSSKSW